MNITLKTSCEPLKSVVVIAAVFCLLAGCNQDKPAPPTGSATKPPLTAGSSKHPITLTKANFQTEVLASSQPVMVDFWAEWCGPCKMIAPVVAELATEFEGKAKVGKVDVDAEPDLAKQFGITSIPTLIIFKNGKQVSQVVGVRSKADLKALLDKFAQDEVAKPSLPSP